MKLKCTALLVMLVALVIILSVTMIESASHSSILGFTVDRTPDGESYIVNVAYSWNAVADGDIDRLFKWFGENKDRFIAVEK